MKYYRFLVVDDEPYVVDTLSSLLESQDGFDLDVYRAYTPSEAIQWLNHYAIDIVISDIQMPEMSGFELIHLVKQRWPSSKAILITAYGNTESMYTALHSDIDGYVLKTESDETILQEIHNVIRTIDAEMDQAKLISDSRKSFREQLTSAKEMVMRSFLKNPAPSLSETEECKKLLGLSQKDGSMLINCIVRDQDLCVTTQFHLTAMQTIWSHFFLQSKCSYFCFPEEDTLVYLLTPVEGMTEFATWVTGTLELVQRSVQETLHVSASYVLTSGLIKDSCLHHAYVFADMQQHKMQSQNAGYIFTFDLENVSNENYLLFSQRTSNSCKQIFSCLEMGDLKQSLHFFQTWSANIRIAKSWHDTRILEQYFEFTLSMVSFLNRYELTEKICFYMNTASLFHPDYSKNWSEVADYLEELLKTSYKIMQNEKGEEEEQLIFKIQKYIQNHISGQLSLSKLSDVFCYNPSYLSHIFRLKSGESITQFIARHKMEVIDRLMLETSYSINEIAEKAGFESRTYFSRFVKKYTGVSPQEHRRKLIAGQQHPPQ